MKIILLLLTSFCPALFAQQVNDGEEVGLQTIVDDPLLNMLVDVGTFTYQVPLEQIGEYTYYVFVFLNSVQSMGEDVQPDENGVILKQVLVPENIYAEMEEGPLPHFLFAYNRYDGRRYYTMAMTDVPLRQVVGNLALSIMHATPRTRPGVDYMGENPPNRIVSLNGEGLRPNDVYELIFAQTGCAIVEMPDGVLSVSCT